jgi:hypothetical protein
VFLDIYEISVNRRYIDPVARCQRCFNLFFWPEVFYLENDLFIRCSFFNPTFQKVFIFAGIFFRMKLIAERGSSVVVIFVVGENPSDRQWPGPETITLGERGLRFLFFSSKNGLSNLP